MTTVTDDAVGVAERKWYIAIVHPNHEKKVADSLEKKGYETYVASQSKLRVYSSGKRKWVDRILIPSKIFILCTNKERHDVLIYPEVLRFMVNPSRNLQDGHRSLATVSQYEIDTLRYMLGQRELPVDFVETKLAQGDPVKVIRGCLKGLEGKVITTPDNQKEVMVELNFLGCAKVTIPASDIELIE